MDPAVIGLMILLVSIVLYVTEIFPMAVTTILATFAMAITGAASFSKVFSGWANSMTFMVLGTIIVGDALFATGAAQYLGRKMTRLIKNKERRALFFFCLVSAVISGFLSNTATAAMMLPIAAAAVSTSGGKLQKKYLYMPIGMASLTGGSLSLIGTPCQMVVAGILEEYGLATTSFWEWAWLGAPKIIILLACLLTFGPKLMKKTFDFPEVPNAETALDVSVENSRLTGKMIISVLLLLFCIVGFMTGIWNAGIVAMVAGLLAFITKCLNYKESIKRLDWNTILITGFVLGFSSCLNESGAGQLLGELFVRIAGPDVDHMVVLVLVAVLASFMGNCISSTPTTSILAPICISIAPAIGMDPRALAIAVAVFSTISIATPTGQAPMTLTLIGGYRYKDYIKVGGLVNVISVVLILLLFPLIYPITIG